MGRTVPMVHAVCDGCGWSHRFQGKEDVELFVSDFHAEDKGTGHPFSGKIAKYLADVEPVQRKPCIAKK